MLKVTLRLSPMLSPVTCIRLDEWCYNRDWVIHITRCQETSVVQITRQWADICELIIWHSQALLPENTRRSSNVGTMLGQRRSRWANIAPTLSERLVFAGCDLTVFTTHSEHAVLPGQAGVGGLLRDHWSSCSYSQVTLTNGHGSSVVS